MRFLRKSLFGCGILLAVVPLKVALHEIAYLLLWIVGAEMIHCLAERMAGANPDLFWCFAIGMIRVIECTGLVNFFFRVLGFKGTLWDLFVREDNA